MAITEDDYDKFTVKVDEIMCKIPSCLENRERFTNLQRDPEFKSENYKMFADSSFYLIEAPEHADKLEIENLSAFILELEKFIKKWRTRPIDPQFYFGKIKDPKEGLTQHFIDSGIFETIRVFPWTTLKDVKEEFCKVREKQRYMPIRNDDAMNNMITTLRNAKWNWDEILSFLQYDSETDSEKEVESKIEKRKGELRKAGMSGKEIEIILDREFLSNQSGQSNKHDLEYDAVRKRKKAADDRCERLLGYFKIGK